MVSVSRNDHINSMNMDKFMVTALAALSIIIAQVFWVTLSCVSSYHIPTVFILNVNIYFALQYLYLEPDPKLDHTGSLMDSCLLNRFSLGLISVQRHVDVGTV
jgi:hypothetical protein